MDLLSEAGHGTLEALRRRVEDDGMNANTPTAGSQSVPLHAAAARGRLENVRYLLDIAVDPNAANRWGYTPLHHAVAEGHKRVVEELLIRGANVGQKNHDGDQAIHLAAAAGTALPDMLKFLVAAGANVNAVGRQGHTPLHLAAMRGHSDVIDALLTYGAHHGVVDDHGYTPIEWAVGCGHSRVVDLLIRFGAHYDHKFSHTEHNRFESLRPQSPLKYYEDAVIPRQTHREVYREHEQVQLSTRQPAPRLSPVAAPLHLSSSDLSDQLARSMEQLSFTEQELATERMRLDESVSGTVARQSPRLAQQYEEYVEFIADDEPILLPPSVVENRPFKPPVQQRDPSPARKRETTIEIEKRPSPSRGRKTKLTTEQMRGMSNVEIAAMIGKHQPLAVHRTSREASPVHSVSSSDHSPQPFRSSVSPLAQSRGTTYRSRTPTRPLRSPSPLSTREIDSLRSNASHQLQQLRGANHTLSQEQDNLANEIKHMAAEIRRTTQRFSS